MEYTGNKKTFWQKLKRDKWLCLMFLPIFIYYLVFTYLPLPGLYMAFSKYNPGGGLAGIFSAEWVGLEHYARFFASPFAARIIRNTFLISLYGIIWGFPLPIIFALALNELQNKWVKKSVQTVSYLPHFISTVVLVGMMKNILAYNDGLVNNVLEMLGNERINFFSEASWFRGLYVGSGVWQGFGFSSILYLSIITGINPELYESAKLDGITKFKEVWYITLPMMKSIIVTCMLLNIGSLLSVGFEKVFLMYSSATYETSDVISTYVYRSGIIGGQMSYSTAVGFLNSIVTFILVIIANWTSRKVAHMALW